MRPIDLKSTRVGQVSDSVNSHRGEPVEDSAQFCASIPVDFECAGRSDTGQQRASNQDQYLIADLRKSMQVTCSSHPFQAEPRFGHTMGKLLVVADGMGGAQAGEVASELAIHSLAEYLLNSMHWLFHPTQSEIEQFVEDLKKGAIYSHKQVRDDANRDPRRRGMGTTLTVAYLMWPMLYVLHIGDSRCYLLRDGALQRLTKDQTLAQHLRDRGHLSEQDFENSPYHHMLVSAIGAEGEPEAMVYKARLIAGDRLMLCSDGVNAHLDDNEIQEILASPLSAEAICERFIADANQKGGVDNITAVVALSRPRRREA